MRVFRPRKDGIAVEPKAVLFNCLPLSPQRALKRHSRNSVASENVLGEVTPFIANGVP